MNLKKLSLAAVLAITQVAAAVPVFAAPVSTTSPSNVSTAEATPTPTPTPSASSVPLSTDPSSGGLLDGTASPTPSAEPTETPLPPATVTDQTYMQTNSMDPQMLSATGDDQLVLMLNSNKMYVNGVLYLANQPMAVKNGVSYVSIRAMVERVGLQVTYDSKAKETVVTKGSDVMRFKLNSKTYTVNGKKSTMKGATYQYKGTFMIPLTSITSALKLNYVLDTVQKRVILTLSTKPKASFTVQPTEIYAGQTMVNFVTSSSSPNNTPIVSDLWGGDKRDYYDEPGIYTVTYSVVDANGRTSDPYTATINVLKPNEAPVANFVTDKEQYKMGEPITYTDNSSDPDGDTITVTWTNKAQAFFTPGAKVISLTATDSHGAVNTFEKTVIITEEQLYNEEDFNRLFAVPGTAFKFDGTPVPTWPNLKYDTSSEPFTLIRSNSPETVFSEGVLYRETATGATRFLIHHKNNLSINTKVYVIATNDNMYPVTITTQYSGFGGPSSFAELTGQKSVTRYWESMLNGSSYKQTVIQPGQSVSILTELNTIAMKPNDNVSMQADLYSDLAVTYSVMMIDANKEPISSLPLTPILPRDGVHNRGTYPDSTRLINVSDLVGTTPARLVIGDNNNDPNLLGLDALTGLQETNLGNFGVLYKIRLERVAANTLITFNPRGGNYMGTVLVNGNQVVQVPNEKSLGSSDLNSVVYRTGDYEGPVEIQFTPASGSNLSINFLFTPLPPKK
ncbi:hypothetical protein H70357_25155 [Paenibacillus sp. FSL H7-0357]|uniref:copper amine oxidase N-terminal domain-containing protein n=1 Tax=Paenibacillus sp. FSL H7-0357 TaxID=1536774 RepID=UPI0004F88AEF|nr:copper amine oxidase N-terminal domain-containing protein [Paenibacillus sp. FSL H7-0357]AIQ19633.1 hypothetical protein H70357_25155 [Paenibacillus sp. FSL H7-0357]